MNEIVQRVRGLLSTRLKLGKAAEEVSDEAPLFGPTGLGLDSIDALELVLGLEKEFGVVIGDRPTAVKVLASIKTIAEFIQMQGKG
ncbi:MAG TPA: phosphopantetheine-binding protein [Candidatus Methylomirabilis sp.]|nr:phosphopantetheine-binding protein [Candidatus Methylomirabilis sp.]